MATQLQLEFDPQKLRLMRAILVRGDQQELIKELSQIFFNYRSQQFIILLYGPSYELDIRYWQANMQIVEF